MFPLFHSGVLYYKLLSYNEAAIKKKKKGNVFIEDSFFLQEESSPSSHFAPHYTSGPRSFSLSLTWSKGQGNSNAGSSSGVPEDPLQLLSGGVREKIRWKPLMRRLNSSAPCPKLNITPLLEVSWEFFFSWNWTPDSTLVPKLPSQ